MKRLLLILVSAGFMAGSAFASCGGCGEKDKEGDKGRDSTKQSLAVVL